MLLWKTPFPTKSPASTTIKWKFPQKKKSKNRTQYLHSFKLSYEARPHQRPENLPLEGGTPQFHGPYPNSRCQPTRQKNYTRGSPKHGNSSSSCNSWRPSKPSATAQPSALICPPASFTSPSQTWKTIPSASRSCDSPGIASLTSWGFPQTSRSLFRPATERATGFRAMCPGLPKLGEGPVSGAAPPRLTENSQRPLGTPPRGPLLKGPRCARSTRKGGGVLQTNAQLKEAMGECLGQLAPWEVFATWTFSRPGRWCMNRCKRAR